MRNHSEFQETPAAGSSKRKYALSETGRASLQASVRRRKPWTSSTGPRTPSGKARARQNAWRHGERSAETRERLRAIRATLRLIRRSKSTRTASGDEVSLLANILAGW